MRTQEPKVIPLLAEYESCSARCWNLMSSNSIRICSAPVFACWNCKCQRCRYVAAWYRFLTQCIIKVSVWSFTLTNHGKEQTELPWVKIMWPATLQMFQMSRLQKELRETGNCIHTRLSEPRFAWDVQFLSADFWMFQPNEERQRKCRQCRGHDNRLLHFHLISTKWHQSWLYLCPSMNFSLRMSSNHGMVQKGDTRRYRNLNTRSFRSLNLVETQQSLSCQLWFTLEKTGESSNKNLAAIFLNKNPETK